MHVAEFSVRRWQFTLVLFVGVALLGVASLLSIPKAEDPTFPYPNFAVVAVLPGATPVDVERLVVDPLERRLKTLDDVKSIKTTVEDGLAVVAVEFTAGSDPARKRDDVLRELTALRPSMPEGLVRLEAQEFNAAKVNILQLALVSDGASYRELDRLSRALQKRLEAVPGVGEVERAGLPGQEVRVAVDPERSAALGISPGEVIAAIGADSRAIPAGSLDAGARQLGVRTSGDYRSVEEIRETVARIARDPIPFRKLNYTVPGHETNTLYEADAVLDIRQVREVVAVADGELTLREIHRRVPIPLVMHGGSGLDDQKYRDVVAAGRLQPGDVPRVDHLHLLPREEHQLHVRSLEHGVANLISGRNAAELDQSNRVLSHFDSRFR